MTNEELQQLSLAKELQALSKRARRGEIREMVIAVKSQTSCAIGQVGERKGNADLLRAVDLIRKSVASGSPPSRRSPHLRLVDDF